MKSRVSAHDVRGRPARDHTRTAPSHNIPAEGGAAARCGRDGAPLPWDVVVDQLENEQKRSSSLVEAASPEMVVPMHEYAGTRPTRRSTAK
jgi:hypothetical protein